MSGRRHDETARRRDGETADSARSDEPFAGANPEMGAGPVVGAIGEGAATRGGEDVRRRGWFWHWNSIVTQYAPLIGLKGVGLLNSYTVWTDRREESPHRGYAFPSQQSEADFYGEDRAELITINKILVALDLIEIRKEMVLRVDERGRRWRVPHNFYRVKDHGDDFTLTSRDVLRVAELADRDKAVYRSIRRVFSPRFAPIDAANVWSRILPEVRQTDLWQRLADRATREEDRASARTRAGHAARKSNLGMPDDGDTATIGTTTNDSDRGSLLEVITTSVASINKGFDPDVASTNNGLTGESTTAVDPANAGLPTDVAPSNRTYYESTLTTTTTGLTEDERARGREGGEDDGRGELVQRGEDQGLSQGVTGHMGVGTGVDKTRVGPSLSGEGAGPGGGAAPADAAGEAVAVRAFEEANGRASSQIERRLLRELAERFEPSAREREREGSELGTGWAWVVAAIYDAVEAGSAFVAPRRIREILGRWEREGLPDEGGKARRREGGTTGGARHAAPGGGSTRGDDSPSAIRLGDGPEIEVQLPHGFSSGRTWEFAVGLLATAIDRTHLAELVAGTAIAGYRDGEVTLAVPDAARAERIAGEYRELFTRKLSEAMRRPVRLAVLTTGGGEAGRREGGETTVGATHASPDGGTDDAEIEALPASFVVAECGLPSGQVWAAVLDELAANGEVSRANVDAWLRLSALIGRNDEGALIVGVPHTLAQRRVTARFLPPLRAAAAAVIGVALPVEVVVTQDWLRTNPAPPVESSHAEPKRRFGA